MTRINGLTVFFAILFSVCLIGCSSKVIVYEPTMEMTLAEAISTTEKLIMTQHANWKPDNFFIRDDYMLWGYGVVTNQQGFATSLGYGTAYGSSKAVTRDVGNRVYYKSIKNVQMMSWTRKFKEWFVVSLIKVDGDFESTQHIYYTRNQDSAKLLVSSLNTIIRELADSDAKILQPESNSQSVPVGAAERLKSLNELYEKGLISKLEYNSKRQSILEDI